MVCVPQFKQSNVGRLFFFLILRMIRLTGVTIKADSAETLSLLLHPRDTPGDLNANEPPNTIKEDPPELTESLN